jgi:acetyl esterase/lipase
MKKLYITVTAIFFILQSFAQNTQPFHLYTDGVPNSKPAPVDYKEQNDKGWVTKVSEPSLTPFFPEKDRATKTAIIVIPGGGYAGIAINHEGIEIAKKFAAAGITAFVLKYRLPNDLIMTDRSIGPLQDAQRAIQVVRERAEEWNLDTNKIGVIGFSAGGHLASTLGTHFQKALIDNHSNISLRPDFMALIYPVITMGAYTHQGSRQNLIGQPAPQDQINLYSNEKQVNKNTPITFLLHAQDDDVVPVKNSLLFYEAMTTAGGKAEMHLYQSGGHGFGSNNKTTPDQWFDRCINWLKANQLF